MFTAHEKKHNLIGKLGKCQLKSRDIVLHQASVEK